MLERLEIHYLANPEAGLTYALLTDFCRRSQQTMPEDEALLTAAQAGLDLLNKQHGNGESQRFLLLHRVRKWNPVEGVWMGWERKRGKLLELNNLLRGATDTSYFNKDIPYRTPKFCKVCNHIGFRHAACRMRPHAG